MNNFTLEQLCNAKCPRCGCTGLHACTGQPIAPWTEADKERLHAAMQKILADEEAALGPVVLLRTREELRDALAEAIAEEDADTSNDLTLTNQGYDDTGHKSDQTGGNDGNAS